MNTPDTARISHRYRAPIELDRARNIAANDAHLAKIGLSDTAKKGEAAPKKRQRTKAASSIKESDWYTENRENYAVLEFDEALVQVPCHSDRTCLLEMFTGGSL